MFVQNICVGGGQWFLVYWVTILRIGRDTSAQVNNVCLESDTVDTLIDRVETGGKKVGIDCNCIKYSELLWLISQFIDNSKDPAWYGLFKQSMRKIELYFIWSTSSFKSGLNYIIIWSYTTIIQEYWQCLMMKHYFNIINCILFSYLQGASRTIDLLLSTGWLRAVVASNQVRWDWVTLLIIMSSLSLCIRKNICLNIFSKYRNIFQKFQIIM